jgi:Uma2 family endonuclease
MAVRVRARTLEEFLALPERNPALEFADGVITQKRSTNAHHSALQAELAIRLDSAGRQAKRATAFLALRVSFSGVSRVPDAALYRWERIPVDASGRLQMDFDVPPDLTVEIVSPQLSVNALVGRCTWYIAHGVQLALLVDPADESVTAFREGSEPAYWRGDNRVDLGRILPDFDLTVEGLFGTLQVR